MSTEIICKNNGPLRISGDFKIFDAEGNQFDLAGRTVISLCRCGRTGNSPFCDGSHKECAFDSVVAARKLPPPPGK
ncbi:MAG TPA: CDGSH iron-sulfur domain-containing protein [Acidobacteriota bacterium]|nr:CDGSH iron-sulfur domain-containing protein [Acidobacteriota bacterium]